MQATIRSLLLPSMLRYTGALLLISNLPSSVFIGTFYAVPISP